jgi:hypothetical protein
MGGTRATGGPVKPDTNDRLARHIMPRPPVDTGMALGTARLLGLPIDDKGLQVIALPFPPLPTVGSKRRTKTHSRRCSVWIAAGICVESVRCVPRALSYPRALQAARKVSRNRWPSSWASKR